MAIHRNAVDGSSYWTVRLDVLLLQLSDARLIDLARELMENEIKTDADLRILVREMVKESIAKMNLQEVIDAAVKRSLKSGLDGAGESSEKGRPAQS